jgi:cob(I)alamin adenosyltransferase
LRLVAQQEGLLQIHTAPFRGSFGAVLSQALRTAGLGSRVLVSQFLKGGVDQGLESSLWLCGRLQWLRPGVPACLAELASDQDPEVVEAVRQVWAFTREQLLSGAVDLMVLDELGLAVDLGYIEKAEVLAVLERRPPLHRHQQRRCRRRRGAGLVGGELVPPGRSAALADRGTRVRLRPGEFSAGRVPPRG